jgi:LPXTG-motif cell wall-anchored protein
MDEVTGGMDYVKISQLLVTVGIAAGAIVGFSGIADAAPSASTAGVACVNGDGVMNLTVTNAADISAQFVITNPDTFIASVIDVAPGSSQVVTVDGLADGAVVVPIQFNGSDASVSTLVACDIAACQQGVLTTVVDENGVQQQACVDSAAVDPAVPLPAPAAVPVPAKSNLTDPAPTTAPARLPTTGAGTGGLVIAALLVGSGSVASLLSRRKADRR